ncbi:MAG: sensor histidine kinase [Rhodanobacteraceae bacterium]|nr:sensor histidine kinase [Rhodanobacteraceae bacterium]
MPEKSLANPQQDEIRSTLLRLRTEQERLFLQLRSGEQRFRQLARSVWRVQEDERRRLARDLHDGIGQHLTALRHRLDQLPCAPGAGHMLAEAVGLCDVAIRETRTLSRLLRPQVLDDFGLTAALGWLARTAGESSRLQIDVETHDIPADLDSELATLLFRVTQEALANVAKHAAAQTVVVSVDVRGDSIHLLVVDDGCGCDVDQALARSGAGLSTGIASMRERVLLFGGRFALVSEPGEGTQVRVSIPLPERSESA